MDPIEKRKRNIIIGTLVILLLVIIGIIAIYINSLRYSSTIDILVAPSFATVEVNDKVIKNNSKIKFEPGNYTIKISANDFISQELSIELKENELFDLYTYLTPTNGSMDWYINHPEEGMLVTTIGSKKAQQAADEYYKKYPIATVLPIVVVESNPEWREYRIDGGQFDNCQKTPDFCIVITDSTGNNRDRAIKNIQDKGYNPNDYEIIYKYEPIEQLNQSTIDKIHQQYGL